MDRFVFTYKRTLFCNKKMKALIVMHTTQNHHGTFKKSNLKRDMLFDYMTLPKRQSL